MNHALLIRLLGLLPYSAMTSKENQVDEYLRRSDIL